MYIYSSVKIKIVRARVCDVCVCVREREMYQVRGVANVRDDMSKRHNDYTVHAVITIWSHHLLVQLNK